MRFKRIVIIYFLLLSAWGYSQEKSDALTIKPLRGGETPEQKYWQLQFRNFNRGYYYDLKKLKEIQKYEQAENLHELLPRLEDYVRSFGIPNFSKDAVLLWKLGQLYEVLDQDYKAVAIYNILLKHLPNKPGEEVLQHFNNWDRHIQKSYYVPLQTYYELVSYRKNIDTLVPPRSVFLNMGELVNDTKYPDYGPTMSLSDNRLIFTKRKKNLKYGRIDYNEEEDLWYTINYDGFWDEAQPFGTPINSSCNEGSACISRDGKTLYFARCRVAGYQYDCADCMGSCDLYVSHLIGDSAWSKPQNLGPNVNSTAWESQPSLSHSEDTLYFASDRLGGFGLSDIYFTYKLPDGTWAKAENMGPVINTRANEVSPFYHPRHHVFYFSSNGHLLNFGGYDIFKSHKKNNNWTEPKNIGPLVNNKGDEYYFTIDSESKDLFYAKAEENDKNLDLFSFPLPMDAQPLATTSFAGSLRDSLTGAPFKGIVSIIDLDNGIEVAPKYLKEDGSYEFDLIDKNNYLLVIQGDDFFRIEERFFLDGDSKLDMQTPSINYHRWKFASLEFEHGSAEILEEMHTDLDKLVNFMVDHPTMSLKISGHTDQEGNADMNLRLSQRRAESIKKYIMENGHIPPERIDAKGYGSQRPIVEEKSEADKRINRRVEFELVKPDQD